MGQPLQEDFLERGLDLKWNVFGEGLGASSGTCLNENMHTQNLFLGSNIKRCCLCIKLAKMYTLLLMKPICQQLWRAPMC